ncbi:MAG: tetratricopeptide repeat protein [Campylobacteraceae bacterium]|jgi:TolA-binding protein|nr:tetratricopeptide repeat protein [Campylobacteraceae bacterium]
MQTPYVFLRIWSFLLVITFCFGAEPSAFDVGRLDSNSTYGLTESEKYLLNINRKIETLSAELIKLKSDVNTAVERSEGAISLLDSLSAKMSSVSQSAQAIDANQSYQNAYIGELEKYVKESRSLELANQETIKNVLTELTTMVDTLSANYAALDKRIAALEGKKTAAPAKSQFDANISSEELFKEGEKLLSNKEYANSKKYFAELISRGYKPARNSYLLGEAEYFSENWSEAIVNYKKSANLYDKADYMSRLLYHTAISFDKLGETSNANQFYKLLKTNYPDSKEAKASPNRN